MQSEVPFPEDEEFKVVYTPYKELQAIILHEDEVTQTIAEIKSELCPSAHWVGIFSAIDRLRRIIKGSYSLIAPHLHSKLSGQIKAGILNLRSTIAKNSLLLVQDIFISKRSQQISQFTGEIIDPLLEKMPSAKNFLLIEIKSALELICKNCTFIKAAFLVFDAISKSKLHSINSFLCSNVPMCFEGLATEAKSKGELLKVEQFNKLGQILSSLLDGVPEQKRSAKSILKIFIENWGKDELLGRIGSEEWESKKTASLLLNAVDQLTTSKQKKPKREGLASFLKKKKADAKQQDPSEKENVLIL